jgi:hypothetical protein
MTCFRIIVFVSFCSDALCEGVDTINSNFAPLSKHGIVSILLLSPVLDFLAVGGLGTRL